MTFFLLISALMADPIPIPGAFELLSRDGGEGLGRLLARLAPAPDRALIVAPENAFVFAFARHLERGETDFCSG